MHGGVSLFLLCFGMHIKYANEKKLKALFLKNENISALSFLVATQTFFKSHDNILNHLSDEKDEGALIILNTSEVPKFYLKCLKRLNPIIIMDALNCFLRKCL